MRNDRFKIGELRQILNGGDKQQYDERKKKLPAFTPAGTFSPTRRKAYLKKHSGVVHHDVDGLTPAEAAEKKQQLQEDEYVHYVFFSPSLGLKLAFLIDPVADDAQYKVAWEQTAEYLKEKHGIQVDESGKDVCRLCYLSYDAALHYRAHPTKFPVDYNKVKKKPEKPERKRDQVEPPEVPNGCAQNVIRCVISMLDDSADGNRHHTRLKAGNLLGGAVGAGWVSFTDALEAVEDAVE